MSDGEITTPSDSSHERVPIRMKTLSTLPDTPAAVTDWKFSTWRLASLLSPALLMMAWASGCSLNFSKATAISNR